MPPADLIVRLPNWIGDSVMALPALQALDRAGLVFEARGRGWLPVLFAGTGWSLGELPRALRPGAEHLRALPPRHLLLMTHSLSSAVMGRLAGKRLCGFRRDGRGILLQRRLTWREDEHEVKRYWRLADTVSQWMGHGPLDGDPPPCRLSLTATALGAGRDTLTAAGAGPDPIVLCPLATGTVGGHDKHWHHYPELAATLLDAGRVPVVIAPPGKRQELAARFPGCTIIGDLAIDSFAGVLAAAGTVVANNSGPMHLACAVGTRCVATLAPTDPGTGTAWSPLLVPLGDRNGWPSVEAVRTAVLSA